jgi:hypothetical protein
MDTTPLSFTEWLKLKLGRELTPDELQQAQQKEAELSTPESITPTEPTPTKDYGLREDGTKKGRGYFGELKTPSGNIMTELSIGVEIDGKETLIPTIVPTLTKAELDYLVMGGKPTRRIVDKAVAFAKERIASGESPFAGEKDYPPAPEPAKPVWVPGMPTIDISKPVESTATAPSFITTQPPTPEELQHIKVAEEYKPVDIALMTAGKPVLGAGKIALGAGLGTGKIALRALDVAMGLTLTPLVETAKLPVRLTGSNWRNAVETWRSEVLRPFVENIPSVVPKFVEDKYKTALEHKETFVDQLKDRGFPDWYATYIGNAGEIAPYFVNPELGARALIKGGEELSKVLSTARNALEVARARGDNKVIAEVDNVINAIKKAPARIQETLARGITPEGLPIETEAGMPRKVPKVPPAEELWQKYETAMMRVTKAKQSLDESVNQMYRYLGEKPKDTTSQAFMDWMSKQDKYYKEILDPIKENIANLEDKATSIYNQIQATAKIPPAKAVAKEILPTEAIAKGIPEAKPFAIPEGVPTKELPTFTEILSQKPERLKPGTPEWIQLWKERPDLQEEMLNYSKGVSEISKPVPTITEAGKLTKDEILNAYKQGGIDVEQIRKSRLNDGYFVYHGYTAGGKGGGETLKNPDFIDINSPDSLKIHILEAQNRAGIKPIPEAPKPLPEVQGVIPSKITPKVLQKIPFGQPQERIIRRTETNLLNKRIRDEARGAKWGYEEGKETTRDILIKKFQESNATLSAVKQDLYDIIKAEIPPEIQGQFLNTLKRNLNPKQAWKELDRIIRIEEKSTGKALIQDISKESDKIDTIAIDFQKKAKDFLSPFRFTKPTEATLKKAMNFADYIEHNPTLLIEHPKLSNLLLPLKQTPLESLSNQAKAKFLKDFKEIIKQGRIKLNLKRTQAIRDAERVRDKLLSTTKNRDISPKSLGYKTRRSMQITDDNTSTIPTIMLKMDGYKWGENSEQIGKLINKVDEAQSAAYAESAEILDEIKTAVPHLTSEEELLTGLHCWLEQPEYVEREALQTALIDNKWATAEQIKNTDDILTLVPPKTERIQKMMDIIRKHTDNEERFKTIQKIYIDSENQMMEKVKNYTPLFREGPRFLPVSGEETRGIAAVPYRTKTAERGFEITRKLGVTAPPRLDILSVVKTHLEDVYHYIYLQPELNKISRAINNADYQKAVGMVNYNVWKDVLDIAARQGGYYRAQGAPSLLSVLRQGSTASLLVGKVSSVAIQPFQVVVAMASAFERWGPLAAYDVLEGFLKSWLIPGRTSRIIKESVALQRRYMGETALEEITRGRGILPTAIKTGLKPLQWADIKSTAGVQNGIEKTLRRYRIPDAHKEAEFFMHIVSGSNNYLAQPMLLAKGGEWARTGLALQNYLLSQWSVLNQQLIKGGLGHGDYIHKVKALIALGIYGAGTIAGDLARDKINDIILDREPSDKPLWLMASGSMAQSVPVFGYFLSGIMQNYDPDIDIPLIGRIKDAGKGIEDYFYEGNPVEGRKETRQEEERRALAKGRAISRAAGGIFGLVGYPKQAEQIITQRFLQTPSKKKDIAYNLKMLHQLNTPFEMPTEHIDQVMIPKKNPPISFTKWLEQKLGRKLTFEEWEAAQKYDKENQ